ncbi:YndM family protein [Thalassobacillus pellis]|uniref:YndM family protein n=1 Tax=Thalassobacillus pellis TaxID=748008 RepID=UPI001962246D|nr:YndM family protein [Thalassobacillus pellis]MBM7553120.1 hypothetical protein [Thalassobacillus pellis]
MEHMKLLAIKFVMTLAVLLVILGLGYDMAFRNVFLITVVLGLLSYVIGDRMILPRTNNTMASVADFGLAFVVIYFMGDALTFGGDLFTATIISSAAVTIAEYFFHKKVASTFDDEHVERGARNMEVSTETSEELFPYDENDKNDES